MKILKTSIKSEDVMTQDNKYKNYTESNGVYYAIGSSTDESWESYVGKLNLIRNPDNLYNLALSLYKQDYKYSAEKFMKISLLGGELRAADMLSTWDSDNKKYYQDIKNILLITKIRINGSQLMRICQFIVL